MSFLKRLLQRTKKQPEDKQASEQQRELHGGFTREEDAALLAGQGETRKHMEEEMARDRERRSQNTPPPPANPT